MIELWRERNHSGPSGPPATLCGPELYSLHIFHPMTPTHAQQMKAIRRDLDHFVSAQTFVIVDGQPVAQPPEEEPRPQYAIDNENASRRQSSGRTA